MSDPMIYGIPTINCKYIFIFLHSMMSYNFTGSPTTKKTDNKVTGNSVLSAKTLTDNGSECSLI